jgi:hypothetical protein
MSSSFPVMALTFLGIIIAALGLFAAGNIQIVIVGLVAIGFAGVLQLMSGRRQS